MEFPWAPLNITAFTEHSCLYASASPLVCFLLKMVSGLNEKTAARNTGSPQDITINLSIRSTSRLLPVFSSPYILT